MPNKTQILPSHWVLVVALLSAGYACYLLISPYINSIAMAFIISLLIFPLHQQIDNKFPKHPNATALISCISLIVIIVIPLLAVFTAIVQQGSLASQNIYQWVSNDGIHEFFQHPLMIKVLALTNEYSPFESIEPQKIAERIGQLATTFGKNLVSISAKILGDATSFLMHFMLMLFVLFFLLRDNDKIIKTIRHILPFSHAQEDRLLNEIEKVSKSAVLGSFLTAIAQGIAGGIGMWMCGFAGLFWGAMFGFASFIPIVGTALIWLPTTAYLLITGETNWGIFLAIWSIGFVGSIDNILRPLLMQGSAGMSTLMIFFSLLGGIQLFGLIGLIYGPIIFAITIVLFNLYEEEFHYFLSNQDKS